jgi:hypothetical protein
VDAEVTFMSEQQPLEHQRPEGPSQQGGLGGEYGYIDYLIDRKFYKRFWRMLVGLLSVVSVFFAILAFIGISKYSDLSQTLKEAQTANERLQAVYSNYLREDSLNAIRRQNSKYYVYCRTDGENPIRESIGKSFENAGFAFADASIESALSRYLYAKGRYYSNDAMDWADKQHIADSDHVAIGVLYWEVPAPMLARIDSMLKDVYPSATIRHFEDPKMPRQGLLYYPRGPLVEWTR